MILNDGIRIVRANLDIPRKINFMSPTCSLRCWLWLEIVALGSQLLNPENQPGRAVNLLAPLFQTGRLSGKEKKLSFVLLTIILTLSLMKRRNCVFISVRFPFLLRYHIHFT